MVRRTSTRSGAAEGNGGIEFHIGGPAEPELVLPQAIPDYAADDFAAPHSECDLIMKGGVTSGVVYPYAILELAKTFRFRSIGGTSAGGIAAAFAAAAEYGRQTSKDPAAFTRFKKCCDELPARLATLFQPSRPFKGLMAYLLRVQAKRSKLALVTELPLLAWAVPAVVALLAAVADHDLLGWTVGSCAALAVAIFLLLLVAEIVVFVARLWSALPKNGLGMCTGLTQPGQKSEAAIDWIHRCLQTIAFGEPNHPRPLTFGDLVGRDPERPVIDLQMITTNLSAGRPHTLPRLGVLAGYYDADWDRLFPASVMTYLAGVAQPCPSAPQIRRLPGPMDLPVVVAVRMSLSFPVLFTAVPLVALRKDSADVIEPVQPVQPELPSGDRIWLTDGGLSSNFPVHMFDSFLPTRPTFALSLDDLQDKNGPRVWLPKTALEGIAIPYQPVTDMGGFASGVLNAAKDWQDKLTSVMPGQRDRIVHVCLDKDEGGLNLTMPATVSDKLMLYGFQAGWLFANRFEFEQHKWKRTLVFYEQLEQAVGGIDAVWNGPPAFGTWFGAFDRPSSYKRLLAQRPAMHRRIGAFAALAQAFAPALSQRGFPRPAGRLRITPKF